MAPLRCSRLAGALVGLLALAKIASCTEIWLYTLVSADYDGVSLMPHMLEHYYRLKIGYHRMLVNVHHNPEKYGREGLDMILGICASYRVYCRVWEGQFSSEDHYNRTLALLNQYVLDPDDWVVVADSDEFQDYGGRTLPVFLNATELRGYTYVTGTLVDRLAPEGRLPPLSAAAPLAHQFPLSCRVVRGLYKGWDFKVVAFKAFLRAGRANHIIVRPDKARAYFGPCAPGTKCPRGRNINLDANWFAATPYAKYPSRYRYKASSASATGLWDAVEAPGRVTIHHYKWHAGVLGSMRDRAEYYSGDCVLGVNEESCTPRLLHWRESAKTYAAIQGSGRLALEGIDCQPAVESQPEEEQQPQQQAATAADPGQDAQPAAAGEGAVAEQAAGNEQQRGQQQGREEEEEGGEGWGEELPEYEPDGGAEEERNAKRAAAKAAKAAGMPRPLDADDAGSKDKKKSKEKDMALVLGEEGEGPPGRGGKAAAGAASDAPEELQQLAAASVAQHEAQRAATDAVARAGAGMHPAAGSMQVAVEAVAGALEGSAEGPRHRGGANAERVGEGGRESGEEQEKEGDPAQQAEHAQQAQAKVQAAVHGAVQAALLEDEDQEAAQRPVVEGDYQGEGWADEREREGSSRGATEVAAVA